MRRLSLTAIWTLQPKSEADSRFALHGFAPSVGSLQQRSLAAAGRQSNGPTVGGSSALDWDPEWPGIKYKRNKVLQFCPRSQLASSLTAKKTHIYSGGLT